MFLDNHNPNVGEKKPLERNGELADATSGFLLYKVSVDMAT
jgi:hypothetical protein